MKIIGPTFGRELVAANCQNGVSFVVGGNDADIQYSLGADISAVEAVIAAHNPLASYQTQVQSDICNTAGNYILSQYPKTLQDTINGNIPYVGQDQDKATLWDFIVRVETLCTTDCNTILGYMTIDQVKAFSPDFSSIQKNASATMPILTSANMSWFSSAIKIMTAVMVVSSAIATMFLLSGISFGQC